MTDKINPDAVNSASDVLETPETVVIEETVVENAAENISAEENLNLGEKTLHELLEMFQNIGEGVEKMKKSKEIEAIKSAFYKRLNKEKTDENPLEAIEEGFKSLYSDYKAERAEFNKQQEKERENNLEAKLQVIEDLKELVEKQEDVSATFQAFREIQNRWREIGPVPAQKFRDTNDTYQFYVEKFYDMVKINRDLRDLDFKKNLEAKEAFCAAAEKLAENENIVNAFHDLQKLHEQWKEFGPVAKEYREDIWNRFKAATAVINKKYQAHFEGMKEQQVSNLEEKSKLCERVEEIAAKEISSSSDWNVLTKEIEDIQKEWKTIGFASKKENQKIYDRFRAACDKFFENKRNFYSGYKDNMNENLEKKLSLIEQAEALKSSVEWKKATDQFIALQKQWKEIGAVPRKKSEQLWKRFRAACDEFFAERDKNAKPENDFYSNLKSKKKLIEEIKAFQATDDASLESAMQEFSQKWQAIGFVPFKEKNNITASYKDAMKEKFGNLFENAGRRGGNRGPKAPRSEKDILVQKYSALQQDIDTYENNIGFFAMSKNSEPLIKQMRENIEKAKAELKELEARIRAFEEESATSEEK